MRAQKTSVSLSFCYEFIGCTSISIFYTAMRKKSYTSLEDLQLDLDIWLEYYNNERPHSNFFYLKSLDLIF